jgi:thiosulfate/3-mercaptopyruvate sulfurtransferase
MTYTTLISTGELSAHLNDPDWVIVDCRFSLADKEQGRHDYRQDHIAGAIYAHLDEDLAGSIIPGRTGRHPLPEIERFTQTLSDWGIDQRVQVVAYDNSGGAIAARLWWMLRWLGHKAIAVLDGGWSRWQSEGYPVNNSPEVREERTFTAHPRPELIVKTAEVAKIRTDPTYRLFDSRSLERYRGQVEPIDPVAGRIPGALSLPFADNIGTDGSFLPLDQLKSRFQSQLGEIPAERAIFYCGSGVTAINNILAMVHVGLGEARLYVGSWSKWITDPGRPVARDE